MPSRYIHAIRIEDAGLEEPAATRERLKEKFPRGATRRMTQLGLLVGAALGDLAPGLDDTLIYATSFGESRALEGFLESFPAPSPALFQTSIHPSAVQQALIHRQQAVRQFFPHAGRTALVAQAALTALLAPTPRAILCGGEERGTWLLDYRVASERSFAFALLLTDQAGGAAGKLSVEMREDTSAVALSLENFFDALRLRQPLDRATQPGFRLKLEWS